MESSSIIQYQESLLERLTDIIKPLSDNFSIKTFAYRRFLTDGRSFGVSTNREWNKWHNQHLLQPHNIPTYEEEIKETSMSGKYSCFRIGEPNQKDELCTRLYDFNIWNTLCIYKKENEYVDGFYFASTKENLNIINIYLNNIVMLEQYTNYFKKVFLNAVNQENIDQLSLPTVSRESFNPLPNFLEKIGVFHKGNEPVLISKREAECLYYFAQGYTGKEIARTLNLSPRTIETFIINSNIITTCCCI